MPTRLPYLLVAASLLACQTDAELDPLEFSPRDSGGIVDHTPQADAILLLANTLSEQALDVDVPLDRRVAQNIVKHRLGHDLVPGTADDNLFETIDELDAVPYLGVTAFQALLAYAIAHDLVVNACTSDAGCASGTCVLERCVGVSDKLLPGALLGYKAFSLRVGAGAGGVQVAAVSADGSSDQQPRYLRLLEAATGVAKTTDKWAHGVPLADSEGVFEAFTGQGSYSTYGIGQPDKPSVCVGVWPIVGYSILRSAAGEVVIAMERSWSTSGTPTRLSVCRKNGEVWKEDLVADNLAADAAGPFLRFDQADRPEVLRVVAGQLLRYRRELDLWKPTVLADGVAQHGLRVVQGGLVTHAFYTAKPVGGAVAQQRYLALTDDGIENPAALPFAETATLLDADVDGEGRGLALYRLPPAAGRNALVVVRVDWDGTVVASTVANPETALSQLAGFAIDDDGRLHLATAAGGNNPTGVLRTLSPL